MFTIALILTTVALKTAALVGYDCHTAAVNITTFSNVDVEPCLSPVFTSQNTTETTVQVIRKNRFLKVEVFQCSMLVDQEIFRCGMFSHSTQVYNGRQKFRVPLSRHQCDDLIQNNRLVYPNRNDFVITLTPDELNSGTVYIAGHVDAEGQCEGTSFSFKNNNYQNVVVNHIYAIYYKSILANYEVETGNLLIDNVRCKYTNKQCEDYHLGNLYWYTQPNINCEPTIYQTIYKGPGRTTFLTDVKSGNTYPILTVRQELFVVSIRLFGTYTNCYESFTMTDIDDLFVVLDNDPKTFRTPGYTETLTENISLLSYVNTKFMYVQNHIADQIEKMYHDILFQQCLHKRTTLINLLTLGFSDPEQFAYSLMHTEGYTAILAGELTHLIQCLPVNVSYRSDTTCYLEIPITYNEKPAFLTPRNRLVAYHGTEVICNPLYDVAYNFSNIWTVTTNNAHVMIPPHKLNPNIQQNWKFDYDLNLGKAGLYSTKDIEKLARKMLLPTERAAIANILVNTLHNDKTNKQGVSFYKLIDDDSIKKSISHYASSLLQKLTTFGIYCSTAIGIITLIKATMTIIEISLNALHLYKAFGWSIKLFGALLQSATTYLLLIMNKEQTQNKTDTHADDPKAKDKDNSPPVPPKPAHTLTASAPMYPKSMGESNI